MIRPKPCRPWLALLFGLVAMVDRPTFGQVPPRTNSSPALNDPIFAPIRNASTTWDLRSGPDRAVVDQVCLVPDLPTFFQAIAAWDQGHCFPILFDDVESSFRFIRAFQPARIIRHPRAADPIAPGQLWDRAVEAVAKSWSIEGNPAAYKPRGDEVPDGLGPTPPGVVLSSPVAPMLAGAVALAAGRFQPLIRLDDARTFDTILTQIEADSFREEVAEKVRAKIRRFEALGDGCDFLTLGGDWPYRYRDAKGEEAMDDRIGRIAGPEERWAFAGRLLGDSKESVYRAMCSLFLQPESALMFNGYDESKSPWSDYSMRIAAQQLSGTLPTSQVAGPKLANLEGWHEGFDPANRFGLVLINSHGEPSVFNIQGGPASTADVPMTVPSSVYMIHSFSAANPKDPSTIAGRWLANGAFVYFGAMNEPYLQAFRSPRLIADLVGDHLPLSVVLWSTRVERFGQPWRMVYLGDPLYRIKERSKAPRIARWEPSATWPAYAGSPRPPVADDAELLAWSLKSALAGLQRDPAGEATGGEPVDALLGLRRDRLPATLRPVYDALLTDLLINARKRSLLKTKIAGIPEVDRSPLLRRTYETILAIDLNYALSSKDGPKARAAWSDLIQADVLRQFKEQSTARVGQFHDSPARRTEWAKLLRSTLQSREKSPEAGTIRDELKRVQDALKASR